MTDPDEKGEVVPITYLPDHMLTDGQTTIPRVRTIDDDTDATDDEDDDTDSDPTAEFCRSWRRYRSKSRSFPF